MDDGAVDVVTDPLFVGLTRPATMWGIPYTAFVFEFMATTLVFLAVGNPIYMLLAAPIHALLYLISANDPRMFDSIFKWMTTNGRCRNTKFWSGNVSFAPTAAERVD